MLTGILERGDKKFQLRDLDRQGRPITELIALPVKDPFHLPRAAMLIPDVLEGAD